MNFWYKNFYVNEETELTMSHRNWLKSSADFQHGKPIEMREMVLLQRIFECFPMKLVFYAMEIPDLYTQF